MINTSNWTYSEYQAEDVRVNLAQGGELSHKNEYLELFYINTVKGDVLSSQITTISLSEAIEIVNKRFGHWTLVDKRSSNNSSSCSSCQAH